MWRLALALAALALLAGCGGGGSSDTEVAEPTRTTIDGFEAQAVAAFGLSSLYACDGGTDEDFALAGGRPAELIDPALDVLEQAPTALADETTGASVRTKMATAADDLRSCEPDLAARVDGALED
jgi:hypothetical protein